MLLLLTFVLSAQAPAACSDAPDCRRQALEASARGEYELAHDLAWRAVQKGTKNDPDLMFVLARAQALSGRAADALVMLGRIADLGVAPDVTTDPDFSRVRALRAWPELEAKLAGKPAPPAAAPPAPLAPSTPAAPTASSGPRDPNVIPFSAPGLEPFALAHDAVSRRFVLGDRGAHRLLVIDEVSRNVVNYVSAASAGFYEQLTAFAIDARRGDLWVASARGDGDESASVVHKLQLVSGRTLLEARAPEKVGAVRFVAVTATADGTVYALDAIGARLFRLRPGARTLEQMVRFESGVGAALAAADEQTLYVAGAKGLLRVDVAARSATSVKSVEDLTGFDSLAWRAGSLLGVEQVAGSFVVVRVRLDPSGTHAQPRQILAASPTPTVGALAGDSFYYLSDPATIRRLPVR